MWGAGWPSRLWGDEGRRAGGRRLEPARGTSLSDFQMHQLLTSFTTR